MLYLPPDGTCDRCGCSGQLAGIMKGEARISLCADCLALCVQMITGYHVQRLMGTWQARRAKRAEKGSVSNAAPV